MRPWHDLGPGSCPARRVAGAISRLSIDAMGVGRAVVDLFVRAALPAEVHCVTITGGNDSRRDHWPGAHAGWYVPKKELVSVVQAGLQGGG